MVAEERMQWAGRFEFVFTSFGYTIGLGNIWRFPYTCYTNGGGAFLLPYLLTVVCCTIPTLFLEMCLGQFCSQAGISAWKISPLFSGVGWAIMFNLFITVIYYIVIIMYAFYYMLVSFVNIGGTIPWQICTGDWNTEFCQKTILDISALPVTDRVNAVLKKMDRSCTDTTWRQMGLTGTVQDLDLDTLMSNFTHCKIKYYTPEEEYWNRFVLGVHESDGLDNLGPVVGRNTVLLLCMWVIIYYCCIRGIRSIAKVIYVTATLPFGLLLILLVRGVTLSGHETGIQFYTEPDWSKLSDLKIWASAATQAMYSMGVAFGSHIALSSHNRFTNNVFRDAIIIGVVNTATSIFAGFVIFSFLGHASQELRIPIEDVFTHGPGILFISYVQGISMLPASALWAFLFYMTVLMIAVDSQFVMTWTIFCSFEDLWPNIFKRFHRWILAGLCLSAFLLGFPLVTKGGIHMVVLLDRYTADFSLTLFVILETVAVCWAYGINNFIEDVELMIGAKPKVFWWYWRATWMVTCPVFCLFILIASAIRYESSSYSGVEIPAWGEAIGWMVILTPVLICAGVAGFQVWRKGSIREAIRPSDEWRPLRQKDRVCSRYEDTVRYNESYDNNYITPITIVDTQVTEGTIEDIMPPPTLTPPAPRRCSSDST